MGDQKISKNNFSKTKDSFPAHKHKKIKARPGVIICPKCHAVYFDKHWHSSDKIYNAYRFNTEVGSELCPEDKYIVAGKGQIDWGGELTLKNIPKDKKLEIIQQIRNISKRAVGRNIEDKIVKIIEKNREIKVLTSENQLAVSIGKQIDSAHKGGKLEIKWSHQDKPARVVWNYK